jgi:hypothetical protein
MALSHPALRLALPLLAVAACAGPHPPPVSVAQTQTASEQRANLAAATATPPTATRMPAMLDAPVGLLSPPPGWSPRAEPAPLPDRGIEAPRDRFSDALRPRLEPMILPPERRQGGTFGSEHLRETGPDRPLDNFLPGARLRIPFE